MRALIGLVVVAIVFGLGGPAAAQVPGKFTVGFKYEFLSRDMAFDSTTGSSSTPVLKNEYDYRQRMSAFMVSGRWESCPYFALEAMVGLGETKLSRDFKGTTPGYVSGDVDSDWANAVFGVNADISYPLTKTVAFGFTVAWRFARFNDAKVEPIDAAGARYDGECRFWSMSFYPWARLTIDRLALYAGPAYSFARSEVKFAPVAGGGEQWDEYVEDRAWGLRLGGVLRLTGAWLLALDASLVDATGLSLGVGFTF